MKVQRCCICGAGEGNVLTPLGSRLVCISCRPRSRECEKCHRPFRYERNPMTGIPKTCDRCITHECRLCGEAVSKRASTKWRTGRACKKHDKTVIAMALRVCGVDWRSEDIAERLVKQFEFTLTPKADVDFGLLRQIDLAARRRRREGRS
jgi:hypothetical protein